MSALDSNKQAYDKQLFSDWVMKVYDRCRIKCVVNPGMYNTRGAQTSHDLNERMQVELNETTSECGKNCLRKYDKVYKLYSNMEQNILQSFCDDEEIDTDEFAKHAMAKFDSNVAGDI